MPSSLGGSLIVVVRQAHKNLADSKHFKIWLQFKSRFRLFEWPVFERNAIVRLFSDMGSHKFHVNPYY